MSRSRSKSSSRPRSRRQILLGGAAVGAAGLASGALGFTRAEAEVTESAITQTASFSIDPERADEAVTALAGLVAAVEAEEPGVLAYICHRASEDPSKIVFFEIYADEKALAAHGQQPHMAALREGFGTGLFKPPVEITKLDRLGGFHR